MQRIVFQPVILAAQALTAISLALAGAYTAETIKLYLYGLPAPAVGIWIGLKLYGKLDDAAFRKIILLLLLVASLSLVVPALLFR